MAIFRSSLTSWFPGMLLTYFRNDFEVVPVAPIITGITLALTFHMRYYVGRTESHEQLFFACKPGTADEGE
jgi:hypothetical protein